MGRGQLTFHVNAGTIIGEIYFLTNRLPNVTVAARRAQRRISSDELMMVNEAVVASIDRARIVELFEKDTALLVRFIRAIAADLSARKASANPLLVASAGGDEVQDVGVASEGDRRTPLKIASAFGVPVANATDAETKLVAVIPRCRVFTEAATASGSASTVFVFRTHVCIETPGLFLHTKRLAISMGDILSVLIPKEDTGASLNGNDDGDGTGLKAVDVQLKGSSIRFAMTPESLKTFGQAIEEWRLAGVGEKSMRFRQEPSHPDRVSDADTTSTSFKLKERLSAQLEEAAKRQVMEAAAKAMRKLLRVTEEEWMDLLDGAVHKTFERGVQLMTEGERNDGLLQLIRGRLRNEQKMPGNLKARVLGRPFEGELLGEGGFLRGVPPVFDVVCESEEVDMIFFSKDSLVALFASQPKLAAKFYYLLAVRLAMQLYHSAGKDEFEIVLLDDGSPLGAHAPKTIQALASEPAYMLVFDQFVHADPKLSRGVGQLVRCVRKVLALQKCGDLMSVNHMVERIYTDYIDGPQRMSQLEGTAFSATAMRALIDRAKQDGAPALRHTFDDVLKLCLVVLEACMPPFTASLHYMYIQELLDREQIPVELEHFQGQQWIGQGSYGTVFQVRKRDTGTRYAMKSMKKSQLIEKLGDELWQAVVLAERQILGRLNHPLIVNLAYAFQNVDYLWLVMDCCDGGDLDAFGIDGQQKMDAVQLRFVGMEITSILAHLYGACCLFRDLKPSNLLLDSSGHCRLADFGTAKMAEKASATEPPESKEYCGSRPYMAPEVQRNLEAEGNEYDLYAGANAYTVACDWFSFGVTMYVLAEQAYPFGPDPKYKNLDKEYVSPSLRGHSDEQTVHMRDFLSGLLDWDPQRRYGGDKARIQQLRDHPYWHEAGLRPDWELAEAGQVTSPLKDLAASFMKCRQASFTSRAAAPANNVFSVFQESVATQKRLDAEEYESELELERVVEGWEFVSHQCLAKEFIQGVATNERVSVGTGNRHVSVDFYDLNNFD